MTERVGNYEISGLIARGGMAAVYLARQSALGRDVALKRLGLGQEEPIMAQRFVREAQMVARLHHEHIVTVFDFFEHEGAAYIAMEYVAGGSLRPWVGDLDLPQVLGVLESLLSALAHAEEHGVSHRDLKPENVLVTTHGSVKVADFGVARAYATLTPRVTGTGLAIGTPAYMAPEQALDRPIGPQTDLYAVGVMAYEMLAGAPPFANADGPLAVLYAHVHTAVPPLAERAPDAPADLVRWVEHLLAKDPEDRPPCAPDAWRELEELAVGRLGPYWRRDAPLARRPAPAPPAAPPETWTGPTRAHLRRPGRRQVAMMAGAAAVAVVVTVGIVLDGSTTRRPPPAGHEDSAPTSVAAAAESSEAAPFDFDGDGRQEVVAGRPGWSAAATPAGSGRVQVLSGATLRREATLGAARPQHGIGFGAALASADFDRDGFADLAVGAPGEPAGNGSRREGSVTVRYGSPNGLDPGRTAVLEGLATSSRSTGGGYGSALATADFDGDGFADLAVGAPHADAFPAREGGSGVIQLVAGGARGLDQAEARILRRPAAAVEGFGTALALGDVDGDGRTDLVAAGPPVGADPGHVYVCRGGRRAPSRCRALAAAAEGAAVLALGDVTGDGRPDIVGGLPHQGATTPGSDSGPGAVRIWPGTRTGPSRRPRLLTQESASVPGNDQAHDEFGASLAVGDLDRDGHADLLIGAPGEDRAGGRVTLVRGARRGAAPVGNHELHQNLPAVPGRRVPGRRFGADVAVLDVDGDDRLDLAVAMPDPSGARLFVFRGAGNGFFSKVERRRLAGRTNADAGVALGHNPVP